VSPGEGPVRSKLLTDDEERKTVEHLPGTAGEELETEGVQSITRAAAGNVTA